MAEERKVPVMVRASKEESEVLQRLIRLYRTSTQQLFQAYIEYLAAGNPPIGYPVIERDRNAG